MAQRLEVHYRWQITEWEHLDLLSDPLFPVIVVDDRLLRDNVDIIGFLSKHKLTFEQFIQRVPDDYTGTTAILQC